MPGEGEEVVFLNKLGEIPVLNDGWITAADYYAKAKDYNALLRLTLSMAETSVKMAGVLSGPVLNHYQPQITNMNEYACKKLDELETKYPSIKQPTEQWKETCSDYVEPVLDRVKPVINQVQDIVDNSKKRINNIKTASTDMIEEVKNRGVGTVNHVVISTFDTVPGRYVTRNVDNVLDMAENFVDKYLPEEEDKTEKKDDCADNDEDSNTDAQEIEEMQKMDPSPKRVLIHASCVTEKIRRRMFRKAVKDMNYARQRTASALIRMTNAVEMIDFAKKNMTTAKDKVDHMWTEIVKDVDPTEEKTVFTGTLEDRIVALGRLLTGQVKSGVTAFEKASSQLGQFARHPISKSKEFKELMETFLTVESFKNLSAQSLSKAKDALQFIQDRINSSLQSMAVDVNMEDLVVNESDLGMQVISTNNNSEEEMEREETR